MKKIFFAAVLAMASLAATAQTYVGGSFGLYRETTDNHTEFTIAPEIGYNLDSKWAVGIGLAYDYDYNSGRKTNVLEVKPYVRYTYFRTENKLVNLFVDGGVDFGAGKTKYEDYKSRTVVPFEIGIRPGVALNLTDKFSLVAHMGFLGYSGGNDAAKDAGYPETFGFDFSSMNLTFGFYYNF